MDTRLKLIRDGGRVMLNNSRRVEETSRLGNWDAGVESIDGYRFFGCGDVFGGDWLFLAEVQEVSML